MGIESAVMYFGKYKGQPLSEVPLHYLQWLKEQDRSRGRELGFGELHGRDVRRIDQKNKLLSIPFCAALDHHISVRLSK